MASSNIRGKWFGWDRGNAVPAVTDLTEAAARYAASSYFTPLRATPTASPTVPEGQVISTDPVAGTHQADGPHSPGLASGRATVALSAGTPRESSF